MGSNENSSRAPSTRSVLNSLLSYGSVKKNNPSFFPAQEDISRILPGYTSVLTRPAKDGVGKDNFDELQHDLEKLLSAAVVRRRCLTLQIQSMDRPLQPHEATSASKRHVQTSNKPCLLKNHKPSDNSINENLEISWKKKKSDKFWSLSEPYCRDVSSNDIKFLDTRIRECSQPTDTAIPEVGENYSAKWSSELLEQNPKTYKSSKSAKGTNSADRLKNRAFNVMIDTFSGPLTQRLLGALVEETEPVLKNQAVNLSDFCLPEASNWPKKGVCMDDWLRLELVQQGVLGKDDLPEDPNDNILLEIKKSVQELQAVNTSNYLELQKLKTAVIGDQQRQRVKRALDEVDDQVGHLYNEIVLKQKQSSEACSEEICNTIQEQIKLSSELLQLDNRTAPF